MPNMPPELTGLTADLTFFENVVNAAPQRLDDEIVFMGNDSFDGGSLAVSGLLAEDRLGIRNEGYDWGQIGLAGTEVTYGGEVFGSFFGGVGETLLVTFNAAATAWAIDALIQNLTYANVSDTPQWSRALELVVVAGNGAHLRQSIMVDVIPDNDPPILADLAPSVTFDEGAAPSPLDPDVTFTDGDGNVGGGTLIVSGLLAEDRIGVRHQGLGPDEIGVWGDEISYEGLFIGTYAGGAGGTLTVTLDAAATVAAVDALIQNLTYFNVSDTPTASRELVLNVTDADGADLGSQTSNRAIIVNVTAVDDLPVLSGMADEVFFLENEINGAPRRLDAEVEFVDGDSSFDGGSLVVRDLLAEDRVGIRNEGNFPGQIGVAGTDVTYSGIVIGSFAGGLGDTFEVTFNAAATDEAIDALIQNLTYANVSDTPESLRKLLLGVSAGDGSHVEQAIGVHVDAENDRPVLADVAPSVTFEVGAAPALLDANVNFTDGEGNVGGGTLTVSGLLAEDRVEIRNQGKGPGEISVAGDEISYEGILIGTVSGGVGDTLTVTFDAAATVAAVDALIQNLTYANVSGAPTASHELLLNVSDGEGAQPLDMARFVQLTGAANPFLGLDAPDHSTPGLIDLDGDGDLDVVVGAADGTLRAFRNDGGSFSELEGSANPFDGFDVGDNSAPAFNDLDGDGDVDAVVGDRLGEVHALRNNGDGSFTELTGTDNPYHGVGVGNYSTPGFIDFDGDGDLDTVVGQESGELSAFRYDGDGVVIWRPGAFNPFNTMDVGSFSAPGFVDVDGDGDVDIVAGQETGMLSVIRNDGGGVFTLLAGAANPFSGWDAGAFPAPTFGDLDGDGDPDLLLGAEDGTLELFDNRTPDGQPIIVNVVRPNASPTLTGLAGDVSFFENDVNAAPQLLDPDVEFADVDEGFDGASLAVSGLLDEDWVGIRNEGFDPGQIGVSGVDVYYGGVFIGYFFGGYGGTFEVRFNAEANAEAIDALIQNLTYANDSDMPTASRTLTLGMIAGNGDPIEQAINVHVVPVNDAPVLTDLARSATFDEGAAPALLDANVSFADAEGNVGGGTLSVSGLLAEDRVGIRDQGAGPGEIGVSGSEISYEGILIGTVAGGVGDTLIVTLNAAATVAAVDALIENLTYFNVSDAPTASRELVLNVTDADGADLGPMPAPASFAQLFGDANPFDSLDTQRDAIPALADLDGDGDLDVVIGGPDGQLQAFQNDGHGIFSELEGTANPFSGVDVGQYSAPAFIDLDGDGDMDAVIGEAYGTLHAFRNEGDGSFTELTGAANPFDGMDVGYVATPGFADLDGDGDLDAVIGELDGTLHSFRDNGDGSFSELTGTANPFDGVDVGDYSTPAFVDIDGDGDPDAVLGEEFGGVRVFRNNGDGTFSALSGAANPFADWETDKFSAPSFGDLDGDGDVDALVGDHSSPVEAFDNITPNRAIIVNVTAVDDSSIAVDDSNDVLENGVITGGDVFANDSDVDGPPLEVSAVNSVPASVGTQISLASGALLTVNTDGTYDYDPNGAFDYLISAAKAGATGAVNSSATDSFTYDLASGGTATVTIIINGVDSAADELWGDTEPNVITGTSDPDLFRLSQGGDDTASGSGGGDTFIFADTFTESDSVDGGDDYDSLVLEGNYVLFLEDSFLGSFSLAFGATTLTNVERVELVGGFSYDITSHDATVAAGALLTVDGSALTASDQLFFDGGGELDGNFLMIGGAGDDALLGGAGSDIFIGGGGQNLLFGNGGTDRVDYRFATGAVNVDLGAGDGFGIASDNGLGGTDQLALIENITGSAFADMLVGDGNVNVLDGGMGADQLAGGDGDDTYVVDNVGDTVTETSALGGTDTVRSSIGYALGANLETLFLTGTGTINGTGNGLDNNLTGNSAANVLNGGMGADRMKGDGGNDTYIVDNVGDVAIENYLTEGIDTVRSSVTFTLNYFVDNLVLTGAAAINGTGNGLANNLTGNNAANVLNGCVGADRMKGDGGDDTYVVDNVGDVVIENSAADGTDTVRSSVTFSLAGQQLEHLVLTGSAIINGTGNALANNLTGNSAANTLNGGAGADRMKGDGGDDTYVVDNAGDQVIENSLGEGTDNVQANVSFTLGSFVENLALTGTGAINGTGNGLGNAIIGNNAANLLRGMAGADTLSGAGGADNLHGGGGHDVLSGGTGQDGFRFDTTLSAASNVDDILDFNVADDTIYLDDAIFTGLAPGALAAGAFRAGSAALDGDDRILYDSATGHIFFDVDGVGGAAAVLFATVNPGTLINAADFVVF